MLAVVYFALVDHDDHLSSHRCIVASVGASVVIAGPVEHPLIEGHIEMTVGRVC